MGFINNQSSIRDSIAFFNDDFDEIPVGVSPRDNKNPV